MPPRLDVDHLHKVLAADRVERKRHGKLGQQTRMAVLVRHARLDPDGRPRRCRPGPAERKTHNLGSARRHIFDSAEAAIAAAHELSAIPTEPRQTAYRCPVTEHWHVAPPEDHPKGTHL